MLTYKWPNTLFHGVDMVSKNSIYSGDSNKLSTTTVQRRKMTKPINGGGMGLGMLQEFNDKGMYKLAWEFLRRKKDSANFMQARYYSNNVPIRYHSLSSIWEGGICGVIQTLLLGVS